MLKFEHQLISKYIDPNIEPGYGQTARVWIVTEKGKKYAYKQYKPESIGNLAEMENHICGLFNCIDEKKYTEMMVFGAFPKALVYDKGCFCGYLMNIIPDGCYSANLKDRHLAAFYGIKEEINSYSNQQIAQFLINLGKAISYLHDNGLILGDALNDQNLLVNVSDGQLYPYFVDTDSLRRKNQRNPAETYHQWDFIPPEGEHSLSTKASDIYKYCLIALRMFAKPAKKNKRAGLLPKDAEAKKSLERIKDSLGDSFQKMVIRGFSDDPVKRPQINEFLLAIGQTKQPAVDNAITLIRMIPSDVTFTESCKSKIKAARTAYDALPSQLRPRVENYSQLTLAEKRYNELRDEKMKWLKETIQVGEVIEFIQRIRQIELDTTTVDSIERARNAYNALPERLRQQVTNRTDLFAAEERLGILRNAEQESNRYDRQFWLGLGMFFVIVLLPTIVIVGMNKNVRGVIGFWNLPWLGLLYGAGYMIFALMAFQMMHQRTEGEQRIRLFQDVRRSEWVVAFVIAVLMAAGNAAVSFMCKNASMLPLALAGGTIVSLISMLYLCFVWYKYHDDKEMIVPWILTSIAMFISALMMHGTVKMTSFIIEDALWNSIALVAPWVIMLVADTFSLAEYYFYAAGEWANKRRVSTLASDLKWKGGLIIAIGVLMISSMLYGASNGIPSIDRQANTATNSKLLSFLDGEGYNVLYALLYDFDGDNEEEMYVLHRFDGDDKVYYSVIDKNDERWVGRRLPVGYSSFGPWGIYMHEDEYYVGTSNEYTYNTNESFKLENASEMNQHDENGLLSTEILFFSTHYELFNESTLVYKFPFDGDTTDYSVFSDTVSTVRERLSID